MTPMAKILVTGGAGFIGAHVARALLQRGDDVHIIDDFNDRYDPRLKEARVQHLLSDLPHNNLMRADIRHAKTVLQLCQTHRFSKIVHLAAWATVQRSIEEPLTYSQVNVDGTVNLLEAARLTGVQQFVFASSSSVYGGLTHTPFKETDQVLHPISPYAATKVAGEVLCSTWHHLYQIPITALRFFTVYGPWGRPEMALLKFTEAIDQGHTIEVRGRETERDFTYIDDIVQGIVAAVDRPQAYAVFNLGNHEAIPLPRFVAAIESALGKSAITHEVPLPPGDVPRTLADISQAQAKLGYTPRMSIEGGVSQFVAWYKEWYVPFMHQTLPTSMRVRAH